MALSEKKAASNKKFDDKTYKRCTVLFRKEELEELSRYCEDNNISKNGFIRGAAMNAVNEDLTEQENK